MLQIILALIFYIWLFLVLFFLWRHALGAGARSRQLTILLADSNLKSAEAARMASEAVQTLAEILKQEQKHGTS